MKKTEYVRNDNPVTDRTGKLQRRGRRCEYLTCVAVLRIRAASVNTFGSYIFTFISHHKYMNQIQVYNIYLAITIEYAQTFRYIHSRQVIFMLNAMQQFIGQSWVPRPIHRSFLLQLLSYKFYTIALKHFKIISLPLELSA